MPTTLAPFLSVRDSPRALAFYKLAFAAEELFVFHDESANQVIAHLSLGESSFWLAEESPEHKNFSPETLNGSTTRMIITTKTPTPSSPAPSPPEPPSSAPSLTSPTVGASAALPTPSATTGR